VSAAAGREHPERGRPRVSPARWAAWFAVLLAADLVFYVLLTPVWLGIRLAGWVADRRRSR
jgi:hypothetical protein